jgi:hypothetical protein
MNNFGDGTLEIAVVPSQAPVSNASRGYNEIKKWGDRGFK